MNSSTVKEDVQPDIGPIPAPSYAAGSLMSSSFLGLLVTQLLGAVNDNTFRWLVIGIGKDYMPANVGVILMAGTACFVLPYLVLAAPAGYLADRFDKRSVIVGCKVAEVVIMALGIAAIIIGNIWLLLGVVAAMGAQSALFGPSKLGSIPEILRAEKISSGNGVIALTTVIATVVGMGVGSWLADATGTFGQDRWWLSAMVLIGTAAVGLATSLLISRLPVANASRTFPWNAATQTLRDLKTLASSRPMLRVALGIMFFWGLGALAQLNIDQFVSEGGAVAESDKVPLLFSLVFGVGLGSVLAGIWSAGRVELGIVPLGALGVVVGSALLFTVQGTLIDGAAHWTTSYVLACGFLLLLGIGAGLFNVPLTAYMQHRSPTESRGAILAANNFMTFGGILLTALLFSALRLPVRDGALDNIAGVAEARARLPKYTIEQLNAPRPDDDPLSRLVAAQLNYFDDPVATPIDKAILESGATGDTRTVLLAELLWYEMSERIKAGESFTLDEYTAHFPEDAQLVDDVFAQVKGLPLFTARQIFLLCAAITLPVLVYIVWLIPQATARFLVWTLSKSVYRIRVLGHENLPETGGAVLVANHVSWLDGFLMMMVSSRPVRMFADVANIPRPIRWIARLWGVIMVQSGPKGIARGLETARRAVADGELVCIFPEGGITRTGQMRAFRGGVMKILDGQAAPVIPVYLDQLWGSIFSFERGKFFWKWPRRVPYPISIHIGTPLTPPHTLENIERAVTRLGTEAVSKRNDRTPVLPQLMIRQCKRCGRRSKIADSSGADLSGYSTLMRALILRRVLRREVLDAGEQTVGVLLPPSVAGVVVNAALVLDRRTSVNLNYTVSAEVMNECIKRAHVRHVVTSRRFIEKLGFDLDVELVFVEDLADKPTTTDKVVAALATFVTPARLLERLLGLHKINRDDVLTIIFTSGTTGIPKGVMLTYGNVGSNCEGVEQMVRLKPSDVVMGILPFFHSFGYTVTIWVVLSLDIKGAYHYSPLDARQIGKLCEQHGGTFLIATPTFLRTYLRRCTPEQFATLDAVLTGAERLPPELADAFEEKFGVRPVEGYGATELSPIAAGNVPINRAGEHPEWTAREGTVGRPLPGVSVKIVHPETGEELSRGKAGMLLVAGPNVMRGYLDDEEKTAAVIRDGWYVTGDVARIDDDGFITITGRESRFSKIGGEMVPHIQIEETLAEIIDGERDGIRAAVTAVPDARKGERLVVVHTHIDETPQQLCEALAERGLPNVFIPAPDSFLEVDELPVLGTGKLDLGRIRQLALEAFGKA